MIKRKLSILIIAIFIITSGIGVFGSSNNDMKDIKLDTFDLVIISPSLFSDQIQRLVEHKNNVGISTFLKTTEEIYSQYDGHDEAEQIKYFIKDAIEQSGVKYVLLVGGRIGQSFRWHVPVRYSNVYDGFMHYNFLSDLYFADIYDENGDFDNWDDNSNQIYSEWNEDISEEVVDLIPDVALGRLPCRNQEEVIDIVEKIISYETSSYGKQWLKNILLIGGDTNPGIGDLYPYEGEVDCKQTKQLLAGYNVTELYATEGTLLDYNDFISSFNKGSGFVLFHGHGLQDGLFTHNIDGEQITVFDLKYLSYLNNYNMYPITVVGCCLTTEFDVGLFNFLRIFENLKQHRWFRNMKYECISESISWQLVKKTDGGSIAHIGSSSTAWGADGDENNDGIPDSVQNGYTSGLCYEFFNIISEGELDILGDVYVETLSRVINDQNPYNDVVQVKCIQEFQMIGDPSLKIGGYP